MLQKKHAEVQFSSHDFWSQFWSPVEILFNSDSHWRLAHYRRHHLAADFKYFNFSIENGPMMILSFHILPGPKGAGPSMWWNHDLACKTSALTEWMFTIIAPPKKPMVIPSLGNQYPLSSYNRYNLGYRDQGPRLLSRHPQACPRSNDISWVSRPLIASFVSRRRQQRRQWTQRLAWCRIGDPGVCQNLWRYSMAMNQYLWKYHL